MPTRTIITLPDPVLRRKARPISRFDGDLQALIDDMIETMREAPGVGLAAPQVNVSERLIVVEYGEEEEDENGVVTEKPKKLFVMLNPEIVKTSEETETGVEGCLSIPGIVGEVERFSQIQIKGLNRRGQPMKVKAEGWLARIFQHEIDHLNGVLFPDRATKVWKPEAELPEEQEV
ncbi:MAG TPA: peptide deformylase [Anaerolineales bacterium]